MTQLLSEHARKVAAIEIDSALIPVLHDTLAECDNVTVINEDIMKMDTVQFIKFMELGMKLMVLDILLDLKKKGQQKENIFKGYQVKIY